MDDRPRVSGTDDRHPANRASTRNQDVAVLCVVGGKFLELLGSDVETAFLDELVCADVVHRPHRNPRRDVLLLLQGAAKRPTLRAVSALCKQTLNLDSCEASRVCCRVAEDFEESGGKERVGEIESVAGGMP